MHVKGYIRDLFMDCLDAWDGETEWWVPLDDTNPSYFSNVELKKKWAGMGKEDRARWLMGQLWNCTDICPRDAADSLNIPGGTYASVIRRLAVTDPPDGFAALIRQVEKTRQQRREESQGVRAIVALGRH